MFQQNFQPHDYFVLYLGKINNLVALIGNRLAIQVVYHWSVIFENI